MQLLSLIKKLLKSDMRASGSGLSHCYLSSLNELSSYERNI